MQTKVKKYNDYVSIIRNRFDIKKVMVYPRKKIWELYIKPKELIDVNDLKSIENKLAKEYDYQLKIVY